MEFVIPTVFQLAIHLPEFAVWIVGIYLAMSRRHEHPTGYPLAAIAFGIFLVLLVISVTVTIALPGLVIQQGMTARQLSLIFGLFGIVASIISTVAWVLVLIALFRRRAM
jgi:hypothetical protein